MQCGVLFMPLVEGCKCSRYRNKLAVFGKAFRSDYRAAHALIGSARTQIPESPDSLLATH